MKKSTNRALSIGLTSLSVISPILDSRLPVLAVSKAVIQNRNTQFNWVKRGLYSSKVELLNDSTKDDFWFFDNITKTIYAKGDTFINFKVASESTDPVIKSIEVVSLGTSLGKIEDKGDLKLLLADIPSNGNVEVIYSFKDGSEDRVPLYSHFEDITGGVVNHIVDGKIPEFIFQSKNQDEGVTCSKNFFKGKIKYSFQSDVIDSLLANIWGTTGYKYKLFIDGEDYSDSRVFSVNHEHSTGKVDIEVDLNSTLKSLAGDCNIELIILDNVGNQSKYTDTVHVDYLAPSISGTILANKWLDVTSNETYFSNKDVVEVSYSVIDTESGIRNVAIIKDGTEIISNASVSGSFIINDDGVYQVKVEDNLGNSKIYGLSEIFPGVSDTVKLNGSRPEIKCKESDIVNKNWFKKGSSLTLGITDDIGIQSIKYVVNNEETVVPLVGEPKSHSIAIDSSNLKLKSNILKVDLIATDVLGKETVYSSQYNVDIESPTLENAEVKGEIVVIDGKAHSKSPLELCGVAEDKDSGIASLDIMRDGVSVSNSLPFIMDRDGDYSVKLIDNVGNITILDLKDIVGKDFTGVVINSDPPLIEATIGGKEVLDSWYRDSVTIKINSKDKENLKSVRYTINGSKTEIDIKGKKHELSLKIEDLVDDNGILNLEYFVVGILGKESSYKKIIKLDKNPPRIENAKLDGDIYIVGNIAFIRNTVNLSADIVDSESKVAKVEVLNGLKVVSETLPFAITEGGVYSVRVTDNAGHVVTKSLKELTGVKANSVIVDTSKPQIARLEGFKADLVKGGVNWYNRTPSLKVSINDDNLDSICIKVNNKEVIGGLSQDGMYNIPIQDVEGSFKIGITAIDKSQNISEDSYEFNIDLEKPSIDSGLLQGDYTNRGYGLYFAKEPIVSLKGLDSGIGVKDYILLDRDKKEVSRNDRGVFTLVDGEFYAKTVDYFGNESDVVSIKDLCSLESNRIVIDNIAPEIHTSSPDGGLNGWYNKNIVYGIGITDNIGISNTKVLINGIQVDSFKADTDVNKVSLVADTSKVYKEDGKYQILVEAEDNTGLVSKWSEIIHIDTTAPTFIGGDLLGNYVDRGDSIVFPSNVNLQVSSSDGGIGLKEITLVDKEGQRVSNSKGLFELTTNEYFIMAEDKLGNKTDLIALKDVCNLPSNNIVVDTVNPVISPSRPEGVISDWFKDDVEYNLAISDNLGLGDIRVSINGSDVISYKFENKSTLNKDLVFSTKGISPNEDGSYNVSIVTSDIIGNTSIWNDTIYIDKSAPVIGKFIITGKGYSEGVNIDSSDKYGFYMQGSTDVEVHISDGLFSSGIDKLHYELVSADGTIEVGESSVNHGVAKIATAEDFKGYISAYAIDRVGNVGSSNRPDGIVSESSNTHINSSKIDISLPSTDYRDSRGNSLYRDSIPIKSSIVDLTSGIKQVQWGVNGSTEGSIYIDNDGNLTGDTGSVLRKDKNLVVEFEKDFSVTNNENELSVWVEVTDRVGHTSRNSRIVSIDKDAPVINVSYNSNNENSFYNKNRVATVSVKERNFKSGDVVFSGTLGSIGEWVNTGNDVWTCNMLFSEDNEYQWTMGYTDMAGNVGSTHNSEKFTIDKTDPVLNVSFDNNRVESGNFYKETRIATIVVSEKNFNPSLVNLEGDGSIGGWSSNGDTHTANVVFDTDGEYGFSVNLSDRAGNASTNFSSGKFMIDKVTPTLNISGVQNGVSYKKNISFKVNIEDTNIDTERCSVSLTGRSIGSIDLIGGINGSSGEFTFSGVPDDMKFDDLYTLKAVIYDKAGNLEEKTLNYSINRYGSRFDFLDTHLLNNIIKSSEDVILEETSIDRLDIDSCKVIVIRDGKVVPIDNKYIKVKELGGKDGNWVYRYFISKEAFNVDGKYQVQIFSKALDGSSNSSLSQEYSFILDTTKPEIIISGVEGSSSYREVSRKVAIEVRDLSGVETIKALLNGKEVSLSEEHGTYSLVIPESGKKQNLVVEVTDKAKNISSIEVKDFLVTSNVVLSIINSSLAKGVLSAVGVAVLSLITVLIKRRKVSKREELELAQEHAKMYHESITGSSTDGGSSSSSDS